MYLKQEDCSLYYEIHGQGYPILFLHGNGEDHTYFQHQIDAFSGTYQIIVMDMRGHGKSTFGSQPLNFTLFAHDVLALLDQEQIQTCHLYGFSDGGNTALTLALLAPTRFSKIVLNGANLNFFGMKPLIQLDTAIAYAMSRCAAFISKKEAQQSMILDLMVHHPRFTIEDLHKIPHQVLVLCGSHDMIQTKHSMLIASHLDKGKFLILPGDHFIARKEYHVVNFYVKKFLED